MRLNEMPKLVQSIPSNYQSVYISLWVRYFLIDLSCTWLCSCPFILLVIFVPTMNNAHTLDSLRAHLPRAASGPVASLRIISHNASASMFNHSSLFGSSFPRSAVRMPLDPFIGDLVVLAPVPLQELHRGYHVVVTFESVEYALCHCSF
jgi:hypothetical protein